MFQKRREPRIILRFEMNLRRKPIGKLADIIDRAQARHQFRPCGGRQNGIFRTRDQHQQFYAVRLQCG